MAKMKHMIITKVEEIPSSALKLRKGYARGWHYPAAIMQIFGILFRFVYSPSLCELKAMPAMMIPAPISASWMIIKLLVNLRLNFPHESSRKTITVCAISGTKPKYIRYCTTVENV